MGRVLVYEIVLIVSSFAASAVSYTGRLIDARCAQQQPSASCNPTPATTQFALISAGKLLTFDSPGNTKATAALKERTSRANGEQLPDSAKGVNARVHGEVTGYSIKIEDIEIQ